MPLVLGMLLALVFSTDPELMLGAAPQDGGVFLTWNGASDPSYRVLWRERGTPAWSTLDAGRTSARAIGGLRNGVEYEFAVEALSRRRRAPRRSEIVRSTPRVRSRCSFAGFVSWEPGMNFFCTKEALDEFLRQHAIDARDVRCRNAPVREWNEHTPDCLFELPDGRFALLLRGADDRFAPAATFRSPSAIRAAARRILWPAGDPFNEPPRADALQPLGHAVEGRVLKRMHAASYRIDTAFGTASRITWFVPAAPVANRFAIYHEGHGGAAVDIGAQTIDWLLERGWTVIAIDMPLTGVNVADMASGSALHSGFDRLDDGVQSPLAHFLMPVKAVVDEIVRRGGGADPDILLVGRSGGGWTAYTYAALDPRVDVVVPVAGGRPLSERLDVPVGPLDIGDYEQFWPPLYSVVGHEDLMIAAGATASMHLFNEFDNCCFRVHPDDEFVHQLRAAGTALGKRIDVFVDQQNFDHSIGPEGYVRLENFLREVFSPGTAQRSLPPPAR